MSTATDLSEKQIDETIQEEQKRLEKWRQRLDDLVDELTNFERESQMKYEDQLDSAREKLNWAHVRLQAMAEGDPKEWVESRSEYQERFEAFKAAFTKTAEQIENENETVALGWLQGFSDKREHDSEGWVEGLGERSEDSEGWVEGIGEQPTDSKGWVEGYNKSN